MRFTPKLVFALLVSCLIVSCKGEGGKVEKPSIYLHGRSDNGLESVLEETVSKANIENSVLFVNIPKHNYSWKEAKGVADLSSGAEMLPSDSYRIASITKTITAVRTLQLVESGLITLEQPINEILSDSDLPEGVTLKELSFFQGNYYGDKISIRQLLSHTSGLKDYVFDTATGADGEIPLALASVLDLLGEISTGISSYQWSAKSLLNYFVDAGLASNSVAKPGEKFHYSDTNYVLLGVIIEKVTNISLAENFRTYIYKPSGMTKAYLEWYEDPYSNAPVDHFMDLTGLGLMNLNLVESNINTSADWAGGGVVTSASELELFLKALFINKSLLNQQSLDYMLAEGKNIPKTDKDHDNLLKTEYGLGIVKKVYLTPSGTKVELWGHEGVYGTFMYFEPKTKSTIVMSVNQTNSNEDWIYKVLVVMDDSKLFRL